MFLDTFELAIKESALSARWMISYRIARSRRLWSAKPLGGAAKSSSREATRERSASALSLTAKNSYRVVGQSRILSRRSCSNFAIRVYIRDSFKERSKWTKSA